MLVPQTDYLSTFDHDGFALFEGVLAEAEIVRLVDRIEDLRNSTTSACAPGMRHLLRNCDRVRAVANSPPLRRIVDTVLGATALPVRAILFDKTPASNWYVTWHQDRTIAVAERIDAPGFGPWSTKDGIVHVQPPAEILERMVSLRLHLDPCQSDNGAIRFIAGSHRSGLLDPADIASLSVEQPLCCPACRGDVIAMRPLILHSSARSTNPDRRRVLHIEYCDATLPAGLAWAEA